MFPSKCLKTVIMCALLLVPTCVLAELTVLNRISYVELDQVLLGHFDVDEIAEPLVWMPIQLPFSEGPDEQAHLSDFKSYLFRIPLSEIRAAASEPDKILSVYIWRHNLKLAVYYGNQFLGGTKKFRADGKTDSGWNFPVMVDIPPPFQRAPLLARAAGSIEDENYLYIHLESGPSGPILSPIVVGARSEVRPIFEERYFLQIEITRWIFALCTLLSLLSIWLWTQRKQDTLYLRFSGMSICSALTSSYFFLDHMPLNMHFWIGLQHAASDWGFYFLVSYVLLALNISLPTFRKLLLSIAVLATIFYILAPEASLQPVANLIHVLETGLGFGLFLYVFWLTIKKPNATRLWFSFAFLGSVILFGHDLYFVFLSDLNDHVGSSNWLHLNPAFIALAFFAHLIHRFVSALDESEALNKTLENRVENTRLQLEKSFGENRKLDLQRSADDERQKIYRDLHDDLGSKLVSIVHASDSSKESELAKGALESLRESIYRANYPEQTLPEFVAQVVEEADLRISSAGMKFIPHVSAIPEVLLSSTEGYHLSRILREAVSNIINHARANEVNFEAKLVATQLNIVVCDDGIGGVDPGCKNGGLSNIRFRADQAQATVDWKNNNPGCCFVMTLPVATTT